MGGIKEIGCRNCRTASGPGIDFTMAFQPVVDISTKRISSYEALVRTPEGGSAASVLSQVTGETLYAFDQACRVRAIELASAAKLDRRLNINFLPNAVYNPQACIRRTLEAAASVGLPLDCITFEIVEDERITDLPHLRAIVAEYRRHGFRIALDDFGAGFAGLNVLDALCPDMVKLDRSLVRDIDLEPRKRMITLGMIEICHQLGTEIVAEGIERDGEFSVLRDAGITLFQGYLFARPTLERLLGDHEVHFPKI